MPAKFADLLSIVAEPHNICVSPFTPLYLRKIISHKLFFHIKASNVTFVAPFTITPAILFSDTVNAIAFRGMISAYRLLMKMIIILFHPCNKPRDYGQTILRYIFHRGPLFLLFSVSCCAFVFFCNRPLFCGYKQTLKAQRLYCDGLSVYCYNAAR